MFGLQIVGDDGLILIDACVGAVHSSISPLSAIIAGTFPGINNICETCDDDNPLLLLPIIIFPVELFFTPGVPFQPEI